MRCDVADARCGVAAREALDRWGRIDALVGNAGMQTPGRLLDATDDDWEGWSMSTSRASSTLPRRSAGDDRAPGRAHRARLIDQCRARASRHGAVRHDEGRCARLMRSLAVDHGRDGMRVNAVCPGATLTDHHLRAAAARGMTTATCAAVPPDTPYWAASRNPRRSPPPFISWRVTRRRSSPGRRWWSMADSRSAARLSRGNSPQLRRVTALRLSRSHQRMFRLSSPRKTSPGR